MEVKSEIDPNVMDAAEHDAVASMPSVFSNRFYIGIMGDNFKITFADQEPNTKTVFPRASVVLPLGGLVQLVQSLQMAYNQQQKFAQEERDKRNNSETIPDAAVN